MWTSLRQWESQPISWLRQQRPTSRASRGPGPRRAGRAAVRNCVCVSARTASRCWAVTQPIRLQQSAPLRPAAAWVSAEAHAQGGARSFESWSCLDSGGLERSSLLGELLLNAAWNGDLSQVFPQPRSLPSGSVVVAKFVPCWGRL